MRLFRKTTLRRSIVLCALSGAVILAGCDEEQSAPSENNTYNVHLYYGKDVQEHKALGQVLGISQCKMTVHTQAARMRLAPHSYSYACCWVHKGKACYEKHK